MELIIRVTSDKFLGLNNQADNKSRGGGATSVVMIVFSNSLLGQFLFLFKAKSWPTTLVFSWFSTFMESHSGKFDELNRCGGGTYNIMFKLGNSLSQSVPHKKKTSRRFGSEKFKWSNMKVACCCTTFTLDTSISVSLERIKYDFTIVGGDPKPFIFFFLTTISSQV